ncbi:glycosyltransferase family 4 protein [Paenibacillus sp. JDR-2]|uniref:glycosyltransferase family 4 protein n=1 Tax=Paenibacillus sp. (strain JDR-2) TaxID=324057 RepID=UPI0001667D38|nr:glycosyltransferase family 4 protein [Paenibacillus sp. JDR-2]ACT04361.1 glycosyl transferase group 1 [Paenibacillus sp. JDR-2]
MYSFDLHPCPGGVNTFVYQLMGGLRRRGHIVDFLCSSHIKFLPKSVQEDINRYRQSILQFPRAVRNIELLKYSNKLLAQHIDMTNYDVIHSNNALSSYVSSSIAPSIPLLGTIHGVYKQEGLLNGSVSSKEEEEWLRSYDQMAVQCPTLVHTVSHAITELMPEIALSKHVVVHNGVYPDQFQPNFRINSPLRIAGAGHFNRLKGYDLLLKALALLNGQDIGEFEVVLYGDGPQRAALEAESKILKLPVTFRGNLPSKQLHAELADYDIFVHPSRMESFGLSVTEALASGCAVICSDVGGLKEQVINGENGLLFELENVYELAHSIRCLATDTELRQRLRRRAVETVREKFSFDNIVVMFEQAYKKTIQNHLF